MATKREKIAADLVIDSAKSTSASDLRYVSQVSAQVNVTAVSTPLGISAQLQTSNDGSNWIDLGSAQNITATGTLLLEDNDVSYRWARLDFAHTSGSATVDVIIAGKECK